MAPARPVKPGMFAPAYEKAFYKGVAALAAGDTEGALQRFRESSQRDASNAALSDELFAGLLSAQLGQDEAALPYLERVVATNRPLPDELMTKYAPEGGIRLGITDHVVVEVPFGSLAAALTLTEIYQRHGRIDEAIGVLQQLAGTDAHPFVVMSLCDLFAEIEAWDEIVDAAAGIVNEDDVSLQVRLLQARAFAAQGLIDAALEVYKDCLRSKKRDESLLLEARYERALLYLDAGKKAQGRRELEKVYAQDAGYRETRQVLESIAD